MTPHQPGALSIQTMGQVGSLIRRTFATWSLHLCQTWNMISSGVYYTGYVITDLLARQTLADGQAISRRTLRPARTVTAVVYRLGGEILPCPAKISVAHGFTDNFYFSVYSIQYIFPSKWSPLGRSLVRYVNSFILAGIKALSRKWSATA